MEHRFSPEKSTFEWSKEGIYKATEKFAEKMSPITKTVRARSGITKAGEVVNKINQAADELNDFLPRASKVAKCVEQFVPSMQVMGQSLCDTAKVFTYFGLIATSVGIAANLVLVYQGVQVLQLMATSLQDISNRVAAHTALIAQKEFPHYVFDMIRERLDQTSGDPVSDHWFFIFHPDNDWYPAFHKHLKKKPLSPRFCGYTNQIDTAFVFMLATRKYLEEMRQESKKRGKPVRPVKLHLLIPAYQPILIVEALKIPEDIGDFVMEGRINSNKEFVWLNLPEAQRRYVIDIGQWIPEPLGWWNWASSKLGLTNEPPVLTEPRVLGTRQRLPEEDRENVNQSPIFSSSGDHDDVDDDDSDDSGASTVAIVGMRTDDASEADEHAQNGGRKLQYATPLPYQNSRDRRRRHHRNQGRGRDSRCG